MFDHSYSMQNIFYYALMHYGQVKYAQIVRCMKGHFCTKTFFTITLLYKGLILCE